MSARRIARGQEHTEKGSSLSNLRNPRTLDSQIAIGRLAICSLTYRTRAHLVLQSLFFRRIYNMPPNPPASKNNQATSRSKPYAKASRAKQRKSSLSSSTPSQSTPIWRQETVLPSLLPGQDSMVDLMREMVQKKFPFFLPRNTMDIVIMSGVDNNTIG